MNEDWWERKTQKAFSASLISFGIVVMTYGAAVLLNSILNSFPDIVTDERIVGYVFLLISTIPVSTGYYLYTISNNKFYKVLYTVSGIYLMGLGTLAAVFHELTLGLHTFELLSVEGLVAIITGIFLMILGAGFLYLAIKRD